MRCLKILMSGAGYPMVATHDPRLVEIALALAEREQRTKDTFELQMLYGIRPAEQERLAGLGHTMRLYVPYGTDWYGYLVRRLAEKPANMRFFAHSLVSRGLIGGSWRSRLPAGFRQAVHFSMASTPRKCADCSAHNQLTWGASSE